MEKKQLSEAIISSLPGIFCVVDHAGKILQWNKNLEIISGYSPGEISRMSALDFFAGEDRVLIQQKIQEVFDRGAAVAEATLVGKDGKRTPYHLTSQKVEVGGRPCFIGTGIDITERKRAEDLIHTQRNLALALSAAGELDKGLHLCFEAALHVSRMDCGGVYLVDETSGALDLLFHKGLGPDFIQSVSHYDAHSANARLAIAGKPVHTGHLHLGVPLTEAERREGLRAIAVLPIHHNDRIIGCLNVASHTLEEVPLFAREPLETIAAQIGSALARLKAQEALRESEARFRPVFEKAALGIAISDLTGRILRANAFFQGMLGCSLEEIVGRNFEEFTHPEEVKAEGALFRQAVEEGRDDVQFQKRYIHKDGRIVWANLRASVCRGAAGKPEFVIGLVEDITERKRAEEALRESEATARALIDSPVDSVLLVNPDGTILDTNQTFAQRMDRRVDELIGRCIYDLLPPELVESRRARVDEIVHFGVPIRFEDERAGMQLDQSAHPIFDAQGKVTKVAIVARDITERKRTEEALRESEAQLRELYDEAPVGYHELDGEGRIRRVNRTELAMLGYTAEEMIGRPVWELVLEREVAHRAVLSKLAGSGLVPAFERTYLRKDGTQVPVLIEDRLLRDAEGRVTGIRSTIQDISARKQAEEAARENQEVLGAVLETTRALIVLADSEGRILLFNRACEELTGHSQQEVFGKSIADCFPDQTWVSIALKLLVDRGSPGLLAPHECPWQTASGEQRLIEWRFRVFPSPHDGRPCVLGTGIDITARKRAENEIRETEMRYRTLFEQSPAGVLVIDPETTAALEYNERAHSQLGYSRGEFTGMRISDFEAIEKSEETRAHIENILRTGRGEFETRHRTKQGEVRNVFVTVQAIALSGRRVFYAVFHDITERKRAAEALEQHRAELRAIYEHAPVMMCVVDADRRVLYANRLFTEFTGVPESDLQTGHACGVFGCVNALTDPRGCGFGQSCQDCSLRRAIDDTFKDGCGRRDIERRLTLERNGVRRDVVLLGATAMIQAGGKSNLLLCLQDITDRKGAEEALVRRTQQLDAIRAITAEVTRELDLTTLLDLIIRRAIELLGANSAMVRLWDEEAQLLIPVAWHGLGDWAKDQRRRLGEALSGTVAQRREGMIVNDYPRSPYANPAILEHVQINAMLAEPLIYRDRLLGALRVDKHGPGGSFTEGEQGVLRLFTAQAAIAIENARLYGTAQHEITERIQAEERLRESEERYRVISTITSDWAYIFRYEPDGSVTREWITDAFTRITGFTPEEVDARGGWQQWVHPEDQAIARKHVQTLREGRTDVSEYRILTKNGETRWLLDFGRPLRSEQQPGVLRVYGAAQDITGRKRALELLLARTRQLEAIRVITAEIAQELQLPALLALITRGALNLVGASSGAVYLWDESAQILSPKSWYGYGEWMREVHFRPGEGVTGSVAERREGMIVNNYRTSPYALQSFLGHTGITAVLAEPLLCREELLGVITINDEGRGQLFTEEDRRTLALFAPQAAIAIENARLHSAAVRRGGELEALLRATRSIMSGLNLQGILDRILTEAAVMSGCPNVKVFLVDRKAGILRVEALQGMAVSLVGSVLPLGTGLTGLAAQTGQPVFSEDLLQDPRNLAPEQDRELGLVTYLGLPIRTRDEVLGVLTFRTTAPRRYTPDEVAYLTSFADQAAVAIDNARLFEQVRTGRERLQDLSHRLVEVQEIERRGVARELHDEIGQLLTGLKLLLEMSGRVRGKALKARLSEAQALANELMMRVRELSLDLRPAILDDLGLLPALLWHFERYTAQTKVRVDFQHSGLEGRLPPEIETAAYRIVQEALNNVARHAGVKDATVRLWAEQNALDLRIEDRGAGFDAESVLSGAASSGLAGMRERATLLGGRLSVASTPGSGTQVVAELPLRKTGNVKSET